MLDGAAFEELTLAERHFLSAVLGRANALDAFSRGLFAESLACVNLPGAVQAKYTLQEWDVAWEVDGSTVTLAVRATGARGEGYAEDQADFPGRWEFKPKGAFDFELGSWRQIEDQDGGRRDDTRRCWADLALLGFHGGRTLADGWVFYVLPRQAIENWPYKSLSPASLAAAGFAAVAPEGLAAEVRRVISSDCRVAPGAQ